MDCRGVNRIDCPFRDVARLDGPCLCEPVLPRSMDSGWAARIIRSNMLEDEAALRAELIRLGWTPPAEVS